MERDLAALTFSALPPEIHLNIFSRIPIKSVFTCKCVCKSWLGLLETPEFVQSLLSKSVPGLIIHHVIDTNSRLQRRFGSYTRTDVFKIFEFGDSLEIESQEHHYKTVLELKSENKFGPSRVDTYGPRFAPAQIGTSTNGLLFLRSSYPYPNAYYVCNPITREYIKLPRPEGVDRYPEMIVPCGFGVSRLSNRYKVVRIFDDIVEYPDKKWIVRQSFAQVFTLGAEAWSDSTTPCQLLLDFSYTSIGKFLNGNLHWLTKDLGGTWLICCFDLETEAFTHFPAPRVESGVYKLSIGVLKDRLCLCDNSESEEITIYLMNDYADEKKSWNKGYVISNIPVFMEWPFHEPGPVYVVKAFGNGDLLLARDNSFLFCYSNSTKTLARVDRSNVDGIGKFEAIAYTPSFISLKDFETENVKLL